MSETLGYYQASLRDENEIVVILGWKPALLPLCEINLRRHRDGPTPVATSTFARLAGSLLGILFFSGCAGYTLGPTNGVTAGDKSVQITPFANKTLEPRLGDAVTTQMRKELQRDGTFKLASHDDGDIIVSGVITHYTRHELTLVPHDLVTVRDYRVTLTAHVTARERGTGKILLDQPVSGFTLLRVGTDLTSSERQALPLLAADLAKHATALLVEGGW